MRGTIIGVMGPHVSDKDSMEKHSFELGKAIASHGYILLTGGRNSGVMHAAAKGAKSAGGLTVGILPGSDSTDDVSDAIDIPIITGLHSARNNINVLSSSCIVSVGMGPGTASELCLALKASKPIILMDASDEAKAFFKSLAPNLVTAVSSVQAAIDDSSPPTPKEQLNIVVLLVTVTYVMSLLSVDPDEIPQS